MKLYYQYQRAQRIIFFHLIAKNEKGFWLLAKPDIKIGIYQHIL